MPAPGPIKHIQLVASRITDHRSRVLPLALALLLTACQANAPRSATHGLPAPAIAPTRYAAGASDDALLDHVQRATALFFVESAHPKTALVSDRSLADGTGPGDVASVAGQGFALSVWCLAAERGWLPVDVARERVLTSLRFMRDRVQQKEGFFYHFVDWETGRRANQSELSSIDTALFLAGALTCRSYFDGDTPDERAIRDLATALYADVNWPFMTHGGPTLTLGWTPEHGFLPERWDTYSELMVMQLLALASPTPSHALPPESWHAWKRVPVITYGGRTFLACAPLFTHQYSQAWFDFRNKHDDYLDYHHNSRLATLAQRQMVVDFAEDFPYYSEDLWGLTASDGPTTYEAWGGPPSPIKPPLEGIVVPCAPGGSVPFAPQETIRVLRNLKENHPETWSRYGFVDAFSPAQDWVSTDIIGIDAGITVMAIENHRTGFFWKTFMADPAAQRAFKIAGFRPNATDRAGTHVGLSLNTLDQRPPDLRRLDRRTVVAVRRGKADPKSQTLPIVPMAETAVGPDGHPVERPDTKLTFGFTWDERNLYFDARVHDTELRNSQPAELLYKGDCIELFIDPQDDGLRWGQDADLQFGFAPDPGGNPKGKSYEWFGNGHRVVPHSIRVTDDGYTVSASLPWAMLGLTPEPGLRLGISPAVRDLRDDMPWLKSEWFLNPQGESIQLGELTLE